MPPDGSFRVEGVRGYGLRKGPRATHAGKGRAHADAAPRSNVVWTENDGAMKSDFLSKILEKKRDEVEAARKRLPESRLRQQAEEARSTRQFFHRLAAPGPDGANIIAEVKRGSPSRGLLRSDLDAAEYAARYEKGGAAAISVLTDETFFYGSRNDLIRARQAAQLPVLRKDFILSSYQIYEAAAWGADAVLLIVRALDAELLKDCLRLCKELQLDALVEVHSERELERATAADARLIGINNRDLTTFITDIETSKRVVRYLEDGQVAVAESGIHGRRQIEELLDAGIWNFLIGESLVRDDNPELLLHQFLGRKPCSDAGKRIGSTGDASQ